MALFVCLTFGMNLIGPLPQTQAQIVPSLPSPGVPSLTLFDALKKKIVYFQWVRKQNSQKGDVVPNLK